MDGLALTQRSNKITMYIKYSVNLCKVRYENQLTGECGSKRKTSSSGRGCRRNCGDATKYTTKTPNTASEAPRRLAITPSAGSDGYVLFSFHISFSVMPIKEVAIAITKMARPKKT